MFILKNKRAIPPLSEECPELPPELCAVVMRLLEHNPAQRYPSARAVLDALPEWNKGQERLADLMQRLRIAGALDRPSVPIEAIRRGHRFRYGPALALLLLGLIGGTAGSMGIRMLGGESSAGRASIAPEAVSAGVRADEPSTPERLGDAPEGQEHGSEEHSGSRPARKPEPDLSNRSHHATQRGGAYTIERMSASVPSNPGPWD